MNFRFPGRALCGVWLICAAIVHCPSVTAEPWIDAGDERSRHHLQTLSDAGLMNLPLTSWPLMWGAVGRELDAIGPADLAQSELRSYRYLKYEFERARQPLSSGAQISASSYHPGISGFAVDSLERMESHGFGSYTGGRWAFKLQASVVGDPIDNQSYRLDGSYVAATMGNWVLGVGAVDRWWGPGWQSSLILSNSARPAPGIFFNRAGTKPFKLPVLKRLGPWGMQVFLNQLEGNRGTPHAKLFGARVTFKPFARLELGLSRTAQWGGEGRPQDLQSFGRMLAGQSNRGGDGLADDGSDEPANQLAGYDWRVSHSILGVSGAFYGQLIGEDEAGGLPYKYLGMAGLESSFFWGSTQSRLALEASNTTAEFNKGGTPNMAYEHPRYPSGYRYRGRPIGGAVDSDSELVVLKGFHSLATGHQFTWTLGSGKINVDGTDPSGPGGNAFSDRAVDLQYAALQYSLPVTRKGELTFGARYYSDVLHIRDELVDSGVYAMYKVRLGQ